MRESVAAITGPSAANLEQFVSDILAGRADENLLRNRRMRSDHHGLIIDPDFSGLVDGEVVCSRPAYKPR
jgi:hypothetical protein